MNLSAYDNIKHKTDKTKTWIDKIKKQIISRELKLRKYYTVVKRYDKTIQNYIYYLVLSDNKTCNNDWYNLKFDDFGRCKIKLYNVWNYLHYDNLDNNSNIILKKVDEQEDGEIYQLEI